MKTEAEVQALLTILAALDVPSPEIYVAKKVLNWVLT